MHTRSRRRTKHDMYNASQAWQRRQYQDLTDDVQRKRGQGGVQIDLAAAPCAQAAAQHNDRILQAYKSASAALAILKQFHNLIPFTYNLHVRWLDKLIIVSFFFLIHRCQTG